MKQRPLNASVEWESTGRFPKNDHQQGFRFDCDEIGVLYRVYSATAFESSVLLTLDNSDEDQLGRQ